ncbi:hypothetical protein [Cupriavidus alkaliphilus]|nr:hypothetical protein [Cupriavidus alkaliphilus]MBB2916896.1 hypothetical protein [Cupriavidus alkaliphilus]
MRGVLKEPRSLLAAEMDGTAAGRRLAQASHAHAAFVLSGRQAI